jgi:hypothetical protein
LPRILADNIKEHFLGQKEHTSFDDYKEDVSKLSKMAEQVEFTIIREAIKYGRMEFQRNVSFNNIQPSSDTLRLLLCKP